MMSVRIAAAVALAALVGIGCAAKRPVLYPNATLQQVGSATAEQEVADCLAWADASGNGSRAGRRVVGQTVGTAAVGSATGAAAGAVLGHAGRGAAVGAAGGGAGGFVRGVMRARDPDPIQRRFVEFCLRERGYQTIGWR